MLSFSFLWLSVFLLFLWLRLALFGSTHSFAIVKSFLNKTGLFGILEISFVFGNYRKQGSHIMSFAIVEFEDDCAVSIVHSKWITPRKREVFWPPYKEQGKFEKALKKGAEVDPEEWALYTVKRVLYETDNYEKAHEKWKKSEVTSNLETDVDEPEPKRQKKKPPLRLQDSSSDEEVEREVTFPRPPKLTTVFKKKSKGATESHPNSSQADSQDIRKLSVPATLEEIFVPRTSISGLLTPPLTSAGIQKVGTHINLSQSHNTSSPKTPTTSRNGSTKVIPSEFVTIEKAEYENIIRLLVHIKEQNTEIINAISEHGWQTPTVLVGNCLPNNFPIELPATTDDDVAAVEDFLKNKENNNSFCSYLSTLGGGKNVISKTNRILRQLLTDKLASKFSFFGTRNEKKAFSDLLQKRAVISAIQIKSPDTTETEIEDSVKTWLKHAPQRMKYEKKTKNG